MWTGGESTSKRAFWPAPDLLRRCHAVGVRSIRKGMMLGHCLLGPSGLRRVGACFHRGAVMISLESSAGQQSYE